MAARSADLIIRLIDQVSGPASRIANRVREIGSAARSITAMKLGQVPAELGKVRKGLSSLSVPLAPVVGGLGLFKLHQDVLEFSKATNKLSAANPDATAEQIQKIKDLSREISRTSLFDPATVMNAANALARADVSVAAIEGTLRPLASAAMAADVPISQLAEDFVGLASGFGLGLRTAQEAKETFGYLGDLATYVAQKAPGSFQDFVQGMKQVAPSVRTLGVDIEWLAGAYIKLDKAGIRNEEAGTALKSLFKSIVKPTAAGRGMLAQMGIDRGEYTTRGALGADQLVTRIKNDFGKNIGTLGPALRSILESDRGVNDMQAALTDAIANAWGGKLGPQDRAKLGKSISNYLESGVSAIDPQKFIEALGKRGVTFGQMLQILEPRQAQRLANIIEAGGEAAKGAKDLYESPVRVMSDFKRGLADLAGSKMMQGYPAAIAKMSAAWHTFIEALDKGGVIDKVASGMQSLAESITKVIQGGGSMGDWATTLTASLPLLIPLLASVATTMTGIAASAKLIGAGAAVAGAGVLAGGGGLAALGIGAAGAAAYGLARLWDNWEKKRKAAAAPSTDMTPNERVADGFMGLLDKSGGLARLWDNWEKRQKAAASPSTDMTPNERVADGFMGLLDKSGGAAAAGQATGKAYGSALMGELEKMRPQLERYVQELIQKMSFSASPTISPNIKPNIAPAPAAATPGKQARLDGLYDFYPHTA